MDFILDIPEQMLEMGEQQQASRQEQDVSTPTHQHERNNITSQLYTRSRAETSQQQIPQQQDTKLHDSFVNSQVYYRRRLVPPPLKYSLEEGHDFERFLQDFETYCDNTYPEVVNTWSRVLGKYLEGSLLDSFNNIDGGRIPYYLVKEKLRK